MVAAVRPTLGPLPRYTVIERATSGGPEILDQAGTIARRVFALPQRDEDAGAMLARHLMWQMVERVGDGAATAAVLFLAIFDAGRTYLAAGGNAMALRHHLDAAARVARREIDNLVRPIEGRDALAQLARSVCFDASLANALGEIFDIIGEYGGLDIRTGQGRDLEREYVEGMFWDGGLLSRDLVTDPVRLRGELEDAAILVSNLEIADANDLAEFLARCAAAGVTTLFLVARDIAPAAMSVLLVNKNAGPLKLVAAKSPVAVATAHHDLEDIAILTGGRAFHQEAGDTIRAVAVEDLGRARRAWCDKDYVGVSGGGGDPRLVRSHMQHLRTLYARAERDSEGRQNLRRRIGKLLGGSATLWVGAATEAEMAPRKALADRTAEALRAALIDGVTPGGGAAYLACRSALRQCMRASQDPDEKAAYRILLHALEAPTRTIVTNAGADLPAIMSAIDSEPAGYGYDVESGAVVDMAAAGILDVAAVTRLALSSAVSAAALALTTDVLVHRNLDAMPIDYTP
jgi:chaperonin GroEL